VTLTQQNRSSMTPEHERELRQQLDRAIGRALVDNEYAAALLANPVRSVDAEELNAIHASSLHDLACQAMDLFWLVSSSGRVVADRQALGEPV
jgi:hypothetical protein